MTFRSCHSRISGNPDPKRMKEYYIYILASKRNGTLYIGVTNNLERRIYEHKEGLIEDLQKNMMLGIWFIMR